jgi:oligopeptide/dipeptide ABC transporter ATP-binding protein
MHQVGIPEPRERLNSYPHQLSGGMCQRIMIAMAIAARPRLLIADEPTTALDVTIQAQILTLIQKLQQEIGMALILITHDIGVVAKMTRRTLVMYAGQKVEEGLTGDIIGNPRHPYTEGLLNCLPSRHHHQASRTRLPTIGGWVPDLVHRPSGCLLHPRCPYREKKCETHEPEDQKVKCHFPRGVK